MSAIQAHAALLMNATQPSLEAQVRAMLAAAGDGVMSRVGLDTTWQNTARTTPMTAGGFAACVDDISGFGHHFFQSTGPSQPQVNAVGSFYGVVHDGIDDLMLTTATFDIKAGAYLAVASAYASGASGSALGVLELISGSTNYFRIGQLQSIGRSFTGSRGASATPSTVANVQVNPSPADVVAAGTAYINSAILSSTGLTIIDSTGTSTTNTAAPFGANVVPAATGSGVKVGFSRAGAAYLYGETIFGAVFCPDASKVDDTIVRAWLRSISGAI